MPRRTERKNKQQKEKKGGKGGEESTAGRKKEFALVGCLVVKVLSVGWLLTCGMGVMG